MLSGALAAQVLERLPDRKELSADEDRRPPVAGGARRDAGSAKPSAPRKHLVSLLVVDETIVVVYAHVRHGRGDVCVCKWGGMLFAKAI